MKRRLRWLVLGAIAVAAASVLVLRTVQEDDEFVPSPEAVRDLPVCRAQGLVFEEVQSFGPETLWEKINGKADFYLESGFVGLRCVRGNHGVEQPFEACEYDMGTVANAFSVFSRQRRPSNDTENDDYLAVQTDDGFFAMGGRYYLEVLTGMPPPGQRNSIVSRYSECYRELRPQWSPDLPEVRLLPLEERIPGSMTLLPASSFGFHRLDSVFLAWYRTPGGESAGFVSLRPDSGDARALTEAFFDFLLDTEGTDAGTVPGIPDSRVAEVMGAWTVVFPKGRVLAGVNEAPTRADAEALAGRIHAALPEDGV